MIWKFPEPDIDPKGLKVFRPIVRLTAKGKIPWGYDVDPDDEDILLPDQEALRVLDEVYTKNYLNKYSPQEIADWVTAKTGRKITRHGLSNRLKDERNNKHRASHYRQLQKRAEALAAKAQKYEQRPGGIQSFDTVPVDKLGRPQGEPESYELRLIRRRRRELGDWSD